LHVALPAPFLARHQPPGDAGRNRHQQHNRVASALILGLRPSRTEENTFIGKVVDDGPATKLATTRSSIDSVNAQQPARHQRRQDDRQA
jgi:hypothetical protein